MNVGEKVKVRISAPGTATRRTGVGGETLWVEVLELPDADGRWSGRLLNKPLFIPAEWGDVVSIVTDWDCDPLDHPHNVDVSPFVAADLDEKRQFTDAPDMSVNEQLDHMIGRPDGTT